MRWYQLLILIALATGVATPAMAQFQQGGVDHPGEWHVGEGLQAGDHFVYGMCHVDYKECAEFELEIWIEGDIQVGTETKWLAHAAAYDGSKITVGTMELGKIAPEPTGGSNELGTYRGAFKSSVVWLSAFANANEPKRFSMPSWGKIANIGGEQILPKEIMDGGVTVRAGHFEEVILVGWRTGGATSNIWVVDDFPFPIKALTWTHVSEGIPPREYEFELLEYNTGVTENPMEGLRSTDEEAAAAGCPDTSSLEQSIKKSTNFFIYQIHAFYTPDPPIEGCPVSWLIKFISKYDDTEFLNEVQYDFWVVDTDQSGSPLTPPVRSIASEEGRQFLYSPSGQAEVDFVIKESGLTNYLIYIYGLSPEGIVPSIEGQDYLMLPIQVHTATAGIPDWIKNTARWWADGEVNDDTFVQGLQYLIGEGIITVPATNGIPSDIAGGPIPDWIKNTARWWADGDVTDDSFIQGLQYLIQNGIIRVP